MRTQYEMLQDWYAQHASGAALLHLTHQLASPFLEGLGKEHPFLSSMLLNQLDQESVLLRPFVHNSTA